ncbi:MAG: arsenate reductase (glutaredoxin) [Cyclobacteriaceae bacterium]|nr:arsenate reductase (glutaredoxin) [Cyclobacteriaceae bacterium]
MTIYHNPRCRKSRETLSLINDSNSDVEIVEYLVNTPTVKELSVLIDKLGMQAGEIVRKNEAVFKEKYKGKTLTHDEWIEAMVQYPKLIERPIVVKGNEAVLGRPPENVLQLID